VKRPARTAANFGEAGPEDGAPITCTNRAISLVRVGRRSRTSRGNRRVGCGKHRGVRRLARGALLASGLCRANAHGFQEDSRPA